MDSSIMLITESLLDSWCGALISLYSSGESTTSSLIVLSRELYCNALRRSLSVFNTEPCVHNLRCTVRLSSFGFILLKLHQAEPLEILCQIQSTLHQIATHPQLEQLRAVDGRIQLKNVFKVPLPKLLGLFHPLLPEAPCQILSISESLIQLFPEMTTDSQTFGQILKVLMQAVRLPAVDINSSSVERKDNQSALILNPAVYTLNLLVKLLDIWQCIDISPEQYAVNVCQLFDLLRVFPMSIEHAEVRLCSWWHFLCRIPRELLNDGFRRFVSPFLANLLGRYLSLSAPMGDPDLHRYKLSVGNAYDGNAKALELTEHVFSSFFKSAGLNLKQLDNVPCLDMDASTLCSNSYQLLVAVVHWLRLICSHADTQSFSLQTEPPPPRFSLYSVDVIWLKCCRAVLESSADAPSNGQEHLFLAVRSPSVVNNTPQPVSRMAIQYVVTCTCHLLTPTPLICDPESKELYRPVLPSSVACLNILEEVFNLTRECTAPEQDKMDLVTDLLLKSNELGNLWITEMAETPKDAQPESVWTQWSDLTTRLISCNSRLNVFEATSGSSFSESWNLDSAFLPLFRRLLTSLLPDSVRLATSCDQVSQNSSLGSLFSRAPSLVYCPAALRFWNELADRLTHFITTEHVICEGDPMITADLSTVYAMLLFPFWFVGPTPSLESNFRARGQESTRFELPHRNEVALVERMDKLFAAFHQEASLLTTLASNAWIGQLGSCLVALVSAIPSEPAKKFNFNFLGRFLRSLAENAEHVEERAPTNAAFDPFSWCGTPEKSFGQLTGLLLALQTCLLHSPWFDAPAPVNHSMPSANISTGRSERDVIKSPSSFLSRVLDCSDESSYITVNSDSNSNTSQSILVGQFTPSHKLSYGLIDALEAVTILIRHHARGPEALVAVIDALNAPLERLTACCARTAADIHRTEVELDEPLLIIQRREQAKIALEEIYICLWRGLDISPITIPQSGLVDVVRTLSHGSVHSGAKVSFSLTSHHCLGLLRASLNLCNAHSTAIDSRSSHAWCFFLWFVGFWNRLVDTCLTDRTSSRGHWDEVRTILAKHEQDVKARLTLLQAKQSTSPVQTSIGGLRQKRTPISSRSRQSGQSDRLSTSFDDNASSARMLNQEFYNQNSRVSRPSRGRPRGGRLSLKRVPSVDIQTTPLRRRVSQERVTSLTQSAPSSLTGSRRSRGRPRASSPTAHKVSAGSPARDVASVQGIDVKGSSEFWSPLCGSPVLLPGRPLVKRRLFPEDANQVSPCRKSVGFSGLRKRILPVTEDTQQLRACDRGVLSPPAPVDFDDSAQFVVISSVPTNMHKRRRTLTAHQKEHFEEQKQGYLPTTYTELDLSQQSISDSQSQSQTQQHIPSSVASVSETPNDIHFPVSTTTTQQTAVESMASAEDAVSDIQNSSPPNALDILSETSSTTAEIVQTTTETEDTPIIHQMDASSIEQHATTSLETESITDPSEQNCGAPLTTDTASPVPPVVATPVCSVGQLPDFIDSPPRVSVAFASRHSRSPTPPSVFVSVPLSLSPLMRGKCWTIQVDIT
ncbi:unnamed protein product [Dicrocoelium dendriticum]|nr:unnamed protein product [Dicrocoelium dendriticum]